MSDEELFKMLEPFRHTLRQYRENVLQKPAWKLSADIGRGTTWITEMEIGHRSSNPGLARLTRWADAVGASEFGLYIVLDNAYTDFELLNPEGK